MSRIRSIHPGLFTDDDYMALSFPARELIKGIWVEADDNGIFEWKLRTIKARIMPADNVDMDALAVELVKYRFIKRFEADGKAYGAVRNFCRYQRPKEPNPIHPIPDAIKLYVCHGYKRGGKAASYEDADSPSIEDRYGETSPELPQSFRKVRSDGGGRREEEEDAAATAGEGVNAVLDPSRLVGKTVLSLMGIDLTKLEAAHWLSKLDRAATWLADGFDPDLDIYSAVNAVLERERLTKNNPSWVPASLRYFDRAIADRNAERINPTPRRDAVPAGSRQHPKSAKAAFDKLDAELSARKAAE